MHNFIYFNDILDYYKIIDMAIDLYFKIKIYGYDGSIY